MQARCVTVVTGVSRSGKSTFALRYLLNKPFAYRFVFDAETGPQQNYALRLNCDPAGDELSAAVGLIRGWVLFNPHVLYPGRLPEAFNAFCAWAFERSKELPGRKVLVVDEAWKYISPLRYPQEIASCVQTGSAYGLECMFNTQLPHKLHEAISNECSELVCFRLQGEKSLAWVKDKGVTPSEVSALTPLHFVSRNLDTGGELRGKIEL